MKRVCVFCGSSSGARPEYAAAAGALGAAIARRGLELVYGGGSVGLMGIAADAALAAGGRVVGVIPRALATKELMHTGLQDLRIVSTMHERKALMVELTDAFVALPGGLGTIEELCEVVTWAQLGIHEKPCAVLNVAGYFDPLLALLDHAVEEGFVRERHRALVLTAASVDDLFEVLDAYRPPGLERVVGLEGA
ncbi:MAG: TIGR00730 family Rossman fold protein [Planctomycetes bacterium]|nr:TIGR00730 family Rossman fold protein [Planctomycetota bacterium]